MTKKDVMKFSRLFHEMVQRKINGKPYFSLRTVPVRNCGGYSIEIRGAVLVHGDDLVAINSICESMCCTFRLYLKDGFMLIL